MDEPGKKRRRRKGGDDDSGGGAGDWGMGGKVEEGVERETEREGRRRGAEEVDEETHRVDKKTAQCWRVMQMVLTGGEK